MACFDIFDLIFDLFLSYLAYSSVQFSKNNPAVFSVITLPHWLCWYSKNNHSYALNQQLASLRYLSISLISFVLFVNDLDDFFFFFLTWMTFKRYSFSADISLWKIVSISILSQIFFLVWLDPYLLILILRYPVNMFIVYLILLFQILNHYIECVCASI